MKPVNCTWRGLIWISAWILSDFYFSYGVVVDGDKKESLSPVNKQKQNEEYTIDSFNVKTCGLSDTNNGEHEFVNMAREGQFPWIASFQIKLNGEENMLPNNKKIKRVWKREDLHFCGGSFISDRWILSAAHCFSGDTISNYLKANKLKAVAGSGKVSSREVINKNLTIKQIFYHARFDHSKPIGFDISLVELESPVNFSVKLENDEFGHQSEPFMNAICLPLNGKTYEFNETARIAGWGLSSQKDLTSMPSKLLTTDILIGQSSKCIDKYVELMHSEEPRRQLNTYNDSICASYKTVRDACQSDSGGPLMQFVNGKAIAIGIVSYGIGCAKEGVPGLYTRTSAYINWIKDITERGSNASVEFKLIKANDGSRSLNPLPSTLNNESKYESESRARRKLTTTTTMTPLDKSKELINERSMTQKPYKQIESKKEHKSNDSESFKLIGDR